MFQQAIVPRRSVGALAAILALLGTGPGLAQTADLVSGDRFRVCADPANTPISAEDGSGYENRIAELLAEKMERELTYTWYPMSTGFIRNTLAANECDVVIGYAQGHELVLNTNHYLTSVFVLIVPQESELADVSTLSDPKLKDARIGIIAGSPPGTHMARNGLMLTARPYSLVVDRRHESPATDMLDDLKASEIDAAILWGPIGGPLVADGYPGFEVIPLLGETTQPRMTYRITMGVRQGDDDWKRELNSVLRRNQGEIDAILAEAGVPLLTDMGDAVKDVSP